MSVVFDKLAFVHRLEADSAFSRGQAEALSEALHTAVNETVATKADLAEIRHEMGDLRHEMGDLRHDMGGLRLEMVQNRAELKTDIRELRAELKLWTGSLAGALFAALGGLSVALRFLAH